jgi:hypothetical protein
MRLNPSPTKKKKKRNLAQAGYIPTGGRAMPKQALRLNSVLRLLASHRMHSCPPEGKQIQTQTKAHTSTQPRTGAFPAPGYLDNPAGVLRHGSVNIHSPDSPPGGLGSKEVLSSTFYQVLVLDAHSCQHHAVRGVIVLQVGMKYLSINLCYVFCGAETVQAHCVPPISSLENRGGGKNGNEEVNIWHCLQLNLWRKDCSFQPQLGRGTSKSVLTSSKVHLSRKRNHKKGPINGGVEKKSHYCMRWKAQTLHEQQVQKFRL